MLAVAHLPSHQQRELQNLLPVHNLAPDELVRFPLLLEDEGMEHLLRGLSAGNDGHDGVEVGAVEELVQLAQVLACTLRLVLSPRLIQNLCKAGVCTLEYRMPGKPIPGKRN